MSECGSMGETAIVPLSPYPVSLLSPAQKGALQTVHHLPPIIPCPWTPSGLGCPRWGVSFCWEGGPREEVYTGPWDRIIFIWAECLRVPGEECSLQIDRLPQPHGLPTSLEVGEESIWPNRSRVGPRARSIVLQSKDGSGFRSPNS